MAVDGHVDIKALFSKSRLDDKIHNGKSVVEGHAEFEAAVCEAFGIQNGLNISGSILGTVAADGSWTMARFSRGTPASGAGDAVGWEFRNPTRAVRFVQVDGTMQVWEEQADGTWDRVRDLEFLEDGALTDLADVWINRIPDPSTTTDTAVKVIGSASAGFGFGLGSDTTISGAEKFSQLDDVVTLIVNPDYLGSEGSVMESYDDAGTIKIKSKLIPALLEESLPTIGMFRGQLDMGPYIEARPATWQWDVAWPGANWVGVDSDNRPYLSEAGVYRITFEWILNSGSTLNTRIYDGNLDPSAIGLYLHTSPGISLFPPKDAIYPEPPWALSSREGLVSQSLYTGKYFDGITILMVSAGGRQAIFDPHWAHNIVGGVRQFTVGIEVERFA